MRHAIAAVTAVSLLLFGLPLAFVLQRLLTSEALTRLQRDATRTLAVVPDNVLQDGAALRVPVGTDGTVLGVYDARGRRVAGAGPATSRLTRQAADGREHDGADGADLAVVVPVLSDTTVVGSVRAALPRGRLQARVFAAWGLLAGLALLVVGVSWLLARRAALRVSAPFEDLTRAARALGEGHFRLDLPRWGLLEADAAARALVASAARIDALVAHERSFTRDASHQLRTPLAALVVQLEQRPPDVAAALRSAEHLERTVADLLALRAAPGSGRSDPAEVVTEAVRRWGGAQGRVQLRQEEVPDVAMSAAALRQSLDVLLDNALRHGEPPVTVTLERYGDAVLVEVGDRGPGLAGAPAGTGLRLAAEIMERAGGSLLVRDPGPHPRLALLLPAGVPQQAQSSSSR